MPANKDFAIRIEIIDECLRNSLHKWTLDRLIETVNSKLVEQYGKTASKRTIQNDIKFLIEEKNAPIAKKKDGSNTYFFYLDKTFSIKNLPLEEDEVLLLKDAINILRQVNEFQILGEVANIIKKLENTVASSKEAKPSCIQFERNTVATGAQYIDDIFASITGKSALRISYQPFTATEPKQLVFHPYLLKEFRNRWFLIGRNGDAKNISILALDRIKEIKNSSSSFITNDLFDPETYFNNIIGVTLPEGQTVNEIEIKVASNQVPYIKTKPIHHTQEITKQYKNGDIIVKLWLINNYELRSVLLSYGGDVEVLKPESLREEIIAVFQKAAKAYQ